MNTDDTVTAAYDGRGQQSNRSVLKKTCFLKYNFKTKVLKDKRLNIILKISRLFIYIKTFSYTSGSKYVCLYIHN